MGAALLTEGWQATLYTENGTAELYNAKLKKRVGIRERSQAATVPLAICAAALRARASELSNGMRESEA